MATDTLAVSIPATCTHTIRMTAREERLRTLEHMLLRLARKHEYGDGRRAQVLVARMDPVFYEICDLMQARASSCECERWT